MANKEPGYVYILTNPSFREDWVKIGKSSRPVDVRSKELDNTAVPLPFEIFATMKTAKYNEGSSIICPRLWVRSCRKNNATPPAPIRVPSISRTTGECLMR